jgi:hypothetical protein
MAERPRALAMVRSEFLAVVGLWQAAAALEHQQQLVLIAHQDSAAGLIGMILVRFGPDERGRIGIEKSTSERAQSPAHTFPRCNDRDAVAFRATSRVLINPKVLTDRIIPSDRMSVCLKNGRTTRGDSYVWHQSHSNA